jgi:hypothetical protein
LKYIIGFFVLLSISHSFSQERIKDTTSTWSLLKYDTKASLKGVGHAFTQPLRWKKKDALTFAGVAVGTAILYSFDEESSEYFIEQGEDIPELVRDFGRYFGNPQNNYALSAGIYGFGLLTKNEKVRKTGVLLIASGFTTGFIQSAAKNIIGRARPGSEYGKDVFKPFRKEGAFHSTPSGHAVLSMTTAHVLAKQFESVGVKILIYGIGSITPISRLWGSAHWLTDIALGTVLSIVVVDSIDNFLFKENLYDYPNKKMKVSWNIKFGAGQLGIVGSF